MHLSLLIQENTGTPSILHSIHPIIPALGLSSCLSLNLIKLILSVEENEDKYTVPQNPRDTLTEFKDVFEGLGSFPRMHKIQLKPDIEVLEPVIHRPCKFPIALQDKLER